MPKIITFPTFEAASAAQAAIFSALIRERESDGESVAAEKLIFRNAKSGLLAPGKQRMERWSEPRVAAGGYWIWSPSGKYRGLMARLLARLPKEARDQIIEIDHDPAIHDPPLEKET